MARKLKLLRNVLIGYFAHKMAQKMEIRGNGIVSSGKGQNTIPVSAYHDTKIDIYGGTFYGWNPEEGDDAMKGSFVAPGYKVIEIQPSVFKVVKP